MFGRKGFIKNPYYRKTKIGIVCLICSAIGTNVYQQQQTIPDQLKQYEVITGNSKEKCNDLTYFVNSELENNNSSYELVKDTKLCPKLKVRCLNKEKDYLSDEDFNSKVVKDLLEKEYEKQYVVGAVDTSIETIDEIDCINATSNMETEDSTDLLSNQLKVKCSYIPTYQGVYVISLLTYKEDDNNYKYDKFIQTLDIDSLEEASLETKKTNVKYDYYKKQLRSVLMNEEANDKERKHFISKRKEITDDIENREDIGVIKTSISDLKDYNNKIQVRVDTDKKYNSYKDELKSIIINSEANDDEKKQFNSKKNEINKCISDREDATLIETSISDLKDYNNTIQTRVDTDKRYSGYLSTITAIAILSGANDSERNDFNSKKQTVINLINTRGSEEEIQSGIEGVNAVNTNIQTRIDTEKAEQAAAAAAAQQRANSSTSSTQTAGGYVCVDGTSVGNADPHAKGRANACYGHGGFAVNH